MRVLITGSNAHLAKVLLPALCNDDRISSAIGIDIVKTSYQHPKFESHIADVRDRDIGHFFRDCDIVIHLAFVVLSSQLNQQRKNRALIRDINVNGSINIFQQAALATVKHIIHLSSAVVYGAWPTNPLLITESQNRKIIPGFSYAEDKNEVEDWLDKFEKQHTIRIVRLRPHAILGPHAQDFLCRLIRQPFYPKFAGPQPLTQCIWETDVVDAIIKSVFSQVKGAFNLAAQPPMSFKAMIQHNHQLTVAIPFQPLKFIHKFLWKISGVGEEPGWLNGAPYSLAVDTKKAENELNWRPALTTLQCLNRINEKPD